MPAFYIMLQEKIPGVDATGIEGRALCKHSDELEALARQAGVVSLMNFFSVSGEEMNEFLEDHGNEVSLPEERWFTAAEGLKTVTALRAALANVPSRENSALAAELATFQQVLQAAQSRNIRWHLGIDY
jgi:hypothetical protein